jgi:hypothetical protein
MSALDSLRHAREGTRYTFGTAADKIIFGGLKAFFLVSRIYLHDCGIEKVATLSSSGLKIVSSNPGLGPVAQNWGVA